MRARSALPLLMLLGCEPRITDLGGDEVPGVYLEAEAGELSGSFVVESDPAASGGRFLVSRDGARSEDEPGTARAIYRFDAPVTGTYWFWGRLHTLGIWTNRFWFQIDDGPFIKWRLTTGDTWFWDDLHDDNAYYTPTTADLSAGPHQITFANCIDGAVLDRLYIAPSSREPAGNYTTCNPPHTVDLDGECAPSCGALKGHCSVPDCAGLPSIATYDCDACCMTTP